jgi:hypothetical protein
MNQLPALDDQDDIPTARTCSECRGAGQWVKEDSRGCYSGGTCRWCKGTGRVPISQVMPKVCK